MSSLGKFKDHQVNNTKSSPLAFFLPYSHDPVLSPSNGKLRTTQTLQDSNFSRILTKRLILSSCCIMSFHQQMLIQPKDSPTRNCGKYQHHLVQVFFYSLNLSDLPRAHGMKPGLLTCHSLLSSFMLSLPRQCALAFCNKCNTQLKHRIADCTQTPRDYSRAKIRKNHLRICFRSTYYNSTLESWGLCMCLYICL